MIKTIRRKIGLNLFGIGLDNVSLDMRSKTQATKEKKIGKLGIPDIRRSTWGWRCGHYCTIYPSHLLLI